MLESFELQRERMQGVTIVASNELFRTTLELIQWWTREGRLARLFFAQLIAVTDSDHLLVTFVRSTCPYHRQRSALRGYWPSISSV